MTAEEAKRKLRSKRQRKVPYKPNDLLSTGSSLLNLCCTGRIEGGFVKGHYHFIVGDSASGKTFLTLTCLAEAAMNKNFDKYRFIYDGAEGGALMDIRKFFGELVAKRMEPPAKDENGVPLYSTTIEEFYFNLDDALNGDRPCIYIQDSMDVLSSEDESKKFDETKEAFRKGRKAAGSYGDGKAKKNSASLRKVIPKLKRTGSILIIINQTRDNLGFGFEKKTRSGGHALRFYATLELWSSIAGKIKRKIKGKDREIGIRAKIKLKKNRVTGRERDIEIPIYYSFGLDEIGSCVDFLVKEGHWKKDSKGRIKQDDFDDLEGSREQIVSSIEESELENDLREVVKEVWDGIEKACTVTRKRRYT